MCCSSWIGCIVVLLSLIGLNGQDTIAKANEENATAVSDSAYDEVFCNYAVNSNYANCYMLQTSNSCKLKRMKHYCPVACNYCKRTKAHAPPKPKPKCRSSYFGCCKDGKTAALGKNSAGCPEKCFDNPGFDCKFYADIGYCEVYRDDMLDRCPLSCGMCQSAAAAKPSPTPKSTCFNKWEDEMCEKFAKKFVLCENKKFKARMKKNCAKSCKKCHKDVPSVNEIAADCAKTGNCCWDKSAPVNGTCPECKDIYRTKFCEIFKSDCTEHENLKSVQIRIYCPKTCKLCSDRPQCQDDVIYGGLCPSWKDKGECKKNPERMGVYCRKTCGLC